MTQKIARQKENPLWVVERRGSQLTIVFNGCNDLQDHIKTHEDAVDTALMVHAKGEDVLVDVSKINRMISRTIGVLMSIHTMLKDDDIESKFLINTKCQAVLGAIGFDRVFNIKYKETSL